MLQIRKEEEIAIIENTETGEKIHISVKSGDSGNRVKLILTADNKYKIVRAKDEGSVKKS